MNPDKKKEALTGVVPKQRRVRTVRSRLGAGPPGSTGPGGEPDGVRWGLVLPAGAGVGALVAILYYYLPLFLINQYATVLLVLGRDSLWGVTVEDLGAFAGSYAMPVLYLLLTVLAASWVGRRVRGGGPLHGALVGGISGVVSEVLMEAIGFLYFGEPSGPVELLIYPVLAIGGGLLGGLRGFNVLAGREVLYEASRGVRAARSPSAAAAAIGENLVGSSVSWLTLWEVVRHHEEDGDEEDGAATKQEEVEGSLLVGSWVPDGAGSPPPGFPLRLDTGRVPALGELLEGRRASYALGVERMPVSWRRAFEGEGGAAVRSVLFVALVGTDGAPLGMLGVASRKKRGFSKGSRRSYLTIASPVALALENLKLLEEARRAGLLGERRRLSHEIHDTLAQGFTSIVMNLEAAEGVLPPQEGGGERGSSPTNYSPEGPQKVRWHLEQARHTARESLAEARRLVWALRPKPLEEASSLSEALSRLAEGWSKESGIACRATVTGDARSLAPEVEVTLLRVAQEALANVRKHAGASKAALTLSYMADVTTLDARDDGTGFDPDEGRIGSNRDGASSGFGLRGMRERVERLGGKLSVESAPGEGTTLVAEVPVTGGPPAVEASAEALAEAMTQPAGRRSPGTVAREASPKEALSKREAPSKEVSS